MAKYEGTLGARFARGGKKGKKNVFPKTDSHGAPAKQKRRANQDGISNHPGHFNRLGFVRGSSAWGLVESETPQHRGKMLSIFRDLNAMRLSTDDINAIGL